MTVETRILATDGLELRIGSMHQFLGETYVARTVRSSLFTVSDHCPVITHSHASH